MDLHVVCSLIFTIHLLLLSPINRDYSWLSFYYIAYPAKNTGERCIFVIYRHKCKCNSLIFIPMIFCLSRWDHIQYVTRWFFIIVLHFVLKLCDIGQFLINTVIIVTFFWGASIASLSSPPSHVSALFWHY